MFPRKISQPVVGMQRRSVRKDRHGCIGVCLMEMQYMKWFILTGSHLSSGADAILLSIAEELDEEFVV